MSTKSVKITSPLSSREATLAHLETELELPNSVTASTLTELESEHMVSLDDVIALLTGLPRNREEETCGSFGPLDPHRLERSTANALRRWHASVWLFKRAANHKLSVVVATQNNDRAIKIEPHDFWIPSCLGTAENSIAFDLERADDILFEKRLSSTIRWNDVRFDARWVAETLRQLFQRDASTVGDAPSTPNAPVAKLPPMQRRIIEICEQLWPGGQIPARVSDRDNLIRDNWPTGETAPSGKTIQRALKGGV